MCAYKRSTTCSQSLVAYFRQLIKADFREGWLSLREKSSLDPPPPTRRFRLTTTPTTTSRCSLASSLEGNFPQFIGVMMGLVGWRLVRFDSVWFHPRISPRGRWRVLCISLAKIFPTSFAKKKHRLWAVYFDRNTHRGFRLGRYRRVHELDWGRMFQAEPYFPENFDSVIIRTWFDWKLR